MNLQLFLLLSAVAYSRAAGGLAPDFHEAAARVSQAQPGRWLSPESA